MNTGEWLRILSTIDNGTALQHFKSIKLQPYELCLTIHGENQIIKEEENILLSEISNDINIKEEVTEIQDEPNIQIRIVEGENINGIC